MLSEILVSYLNKHFAALVSLSVLIFPVFPLAEQHISPIKLTWPIKCNLDQDCFLQQLVDMDETKAAVDPFCGHATYEGHKGTDIRLRTLEDVKANVRVLAAADGTIKGVRKNKPDRLVRSEKDRSAVKNVECGNGVVIDHGNNIETQYCHLKQNSTNLSVGDKVKAGDTLGFVGASGLTQFPHLHIALRKDGEVIDPFTGNKPTNDCKRNTDNNWWIDQSILIAKRDAILLDSNITGAPIKHNMLKIRSPSLAETDNSATVGWIWYANLKREDQVFIKLQGPNGFEVETLTKPMNNNKASWSGFVGKKKKPQIGDYKLTSYVWRKDEKLSFNEKIVTIKK